MDLELKANSPVPYFKATLGLPQSLTRMAREHSAASASLVDRYGQWVHRCVSLNASTAATVELRLFSFSAAYAKIYKSRRPISDRDHKFFSGQDDIKPGAHAKSLIRSRIDDLTEITDHPVLELLSRPNDWTTGYERRVALYSDLQVFGRAFEHIVEDGGGIPAQMWRMQPEKTKVVPSVSQFVEMFKYGSGPDELEMPADEVLWFRHYDPRDPWGGMGPLEAWLRTIDSSNAITAFQYWIFDRGGSPDYVVQTDRPTPEKEKRSFRKAWRQMFGRLANRESHVAFMSGGKIEKLGQTNRELEFADSARQVRDFIGQAFGVPKAFLTSDDVNRNNLEGSKELHVRGTVWPMVHIVEDRLNADLAQRYGDQIVLVHMNPIPEDQESARAERDSRLRSGWTIDEIRIEAGEEPLGGDLGTTPMVGSDLKTLDSVLNPPEPPPMLPGPEGAEDDEEPEEGEEEPQEDEDEAVERMVTVVSHAALLPPPATKEFAGDPETLELDAREDDPFARSVASALKTVRDDVISQLEQDAADSGEKALRPQGPQNPMDYLVDAMVEWAGLVSGSILPHIERILQATGEEAVAQVEAMKPVGISFDIENPAVTRYAADTSRKVGRAATDTYREAIRRELEEGIKKGEGSMEIARRLRKNITAEFTMAQAQRIARTEHAFASIAGTEFGWKQTGVVIGKQFVMSAEPCPLCVAVSERFGDGRGPISESKTVPLGQPFFKVGETVQLKDGKTHAFNYAPDGETVIVPPVHPNCRCSIRPILEGEV